MSEACRNCRFYKINDRNYGICRRHPPSNNEPDWWPHSSNDSWCGEYKPLSTESNQEKK